MSDARRIVYTPRALKALRKVGSVAAERIIAKIEQYAAAPETLANVVTEMKGMQGVIRMRVGDWRVLMTETLTVLTVLDAGHRGGIYD